MLTYITRRLLLMIPTLFGICLVVFTIMQFVPGGPVERMIFTLTHGNISRGEVSASLDKDTRGAGELPPEQVEKIKKLYGFDKPAHIRFIEMMGRFVRFDFGESFIYHRPVIKVVISKLPVSISLGVWSTLIIYFTCIPLGIKKAITHGSRFDVASSTIILIGYSIPGFIFGVLMIVLFGGGSFWQLFPLRGLVSDNFHQLSFLAKIVDYFWHLVLPIASMVISGFATLTLLTKNFFLDEIHQQYVITARAKGLSEKSILYGHVFRNAMLQIVTGFPSQFVAMFFTGSLLIETLFSLDGLGFLSYNSVIQRDYPVVMGTLFFFSLIGLFMRLVTDMTYVLVDPRIQFEKLS